MLKHWRHAVVGAGVIGEWHARVIQTLLPGSSLEGVCDVDQKKLDKLAAGHRSSARIPTFTDLAEMLRKLGDQIDVVHICTPSGNHLEPAIIAMEAGKHVICEKPMEIAFDRIDRNPQC
jgi:predicted dehydrogenase